MHQSPKRPANLHFIYGQLLNPQQIARCCSHPKVVAIARLPDHALTFFGHSPRWDGGQETVLAKPGQDVFGVVYQLSGSDEDQMDAQQGIRLNGTGSYFHYPVEVIGQDGRPYRTLLYKKTQLGSPVRPSQLYLQSLIAGAREQGLPADYLAFLATIPYEQTGLSSPRGETHRMITISHASCQC